MEPRRFHTGDLIRPADPTPTPTMPAACKPWNYERVEDKFVLYSVLEGCMNFLKALPAAPTPKPPPTLTFRASHPTLYVFTEPVIDAETTSVIIRELVARLSGVLVAEYRSNPYRAPWIIGRPDWSTEQNYVMQCQSDSNTIGAIFLRAGSLQTRSLSYIVYLDNGSQLRYSAEVRGCGDDDHDPSAIPMILWSSTTQTFGSAHQGAIALGPIASVAALLSKNTTTQTLTTSSTPPPKSSSPTTQTTSSTNTALTPSLIIGTVASQLTSITIPTANQSAQTYLSSERAAADLLHKLNSTCSDVNWYWDAKNVDPATHRAPLNPAPTLTQKAHYEYIFLCGLLNNFDDRAPEGWEQGWPASN